MANTLRIKRRAAGGAAGAPTSLAAAELAYNEQDNILYYGKGDVSGVASTVVAIAGAGAYVGTGSLGAASGVATLGADGKLTAAQIPSSLVGGMIYKGVWNASTNSPAITSAVGTKGWYYKVSVAGTTSIDGNASWTVGDMIVFNGAAWDIIQGGTSDVSSVYGRVGAVTPTAAEVRGSLGVTTLSGSNTGDQVLPTTLPASDVYAWAKAASKPTYTAAEVGALTPTGSAAGLTNFPTLNQSTTGTACGLTGTPNITVGTVTSTSFSATATCKVGSGTAGAWATPYMMSGNGTVFAWAGMAGGFASGVSINATVPSGVGFVSEAQTNGVGSWMTHFQAGSTTITSGSLGNEVGFYCEDLANSTNGFGFRGIVIAGASKYNLYMDGTAKNYLNGNLGIGQQPSATAALAVTGTQEITGQITSTLATGTAPLSVTSTTMCTNLNANYVGGVALSGLLQTSSTIDGGTF